MLGRGMPELSAEIVSNQEKRCKLETLNYLGLQEEDTPKAQHSIHLEGKY